MGQARWAPQVFDGAGKMGVAGVRWGRQDGRRRCFDGAGKMSNAGVRWGRQDGRSGHPMGQAFDGADKMGNSGVRWGRREAQSRRLMGQARWARKGCFSKSGEKICSVHESFSAPVLLHGEYSQHSETNKHYQFTLACLP